jgi:hypothetical protein
VLACLLGPISPRPRHSSWKYRYLDGPCYISSLQSGDDRIAMMAAQAILDRGYGKPTQSIDANINDDPVRYIVELPEKSATTEEWLEGIRREDAGRALVTGAAAAVDDEQTH